jgi:hypothetical protein
MAPGTVPITLSGLSQLLGGLVFAFCCHDLCSPFPLSFSLLGHGPFHAFGNFHVFYFN